MAGIASMARHTAKSQKDLKKLVRKMDSKINMYYERTGKTLDQATLASVMANMLDPVTQREFVKEKILGNHKEMRQRILDLANEAHDHEGVAPMDLSKINEKFDEDESSDNPSEDD